MYVGCILSSFFITTAPYTLCQQLTLAPSKQHTSLFFFVCVISPLSPLSQGVNSMFQVFLTGNNSEYFTMSPTAVQGRADIRMRVAMPLDYEHIRSYSFSVSFHLMAVLTCI